MNKYQEALNYLYGDSVDLNESLLVDYKLTQVWKEETEQFRETLQELVDTYQEYLELKAKATPKKPKRKLIEKEDLWNEETTIVGIDICDCCKNQVQHSEKFCKRCGQALSWEE